VQIFKLRI